MEKIDVLAEYLEYRQHNRYTSLEASFSKVYTNTLAKLRRWLQTTGGGAIQKLTNKPWQEPSFKKLIINDLTDTSKQFNYHFDDKWSMMTDSDAGWFTIGGRAIIHRDRNQLLKTWNLEVTEYNELMATYYPICIKYLDWALNTTQSVLLAHHTNSGADYDQLIEDRPQTVAEAIGTHSSYWIGMRSPIPLSMNKQFGESTLTIVDIPVKPPSVGKVPVPGILIKEASQIAATYVRYEQCIDSLNTMFIEFDKRVDRLKSYREITSTTDEYHRILTDIDQEMMLYFNIELFSALYSRAGSIQSSIAHFIHHSMIHE